MPIKSTTGKPTVPPEDAPVRKRLSFDEMIIPAANFTGADSTNVLVIGAPNSKKTLSLRSIPDTWIPWGGTEEKPFRVLYLNADDRAVVIDWSARPNWSVINLPFEYSSPEEIVQLHKDVLDNLKHSWNPTTKVNDRFDCVIYDSLTPLSENMSNYTWTTVRPGERDKGVTVAQWSSGYLGNEDRYGTVSHLLKMFLFGLRDSVQFFFAIAHEKEPFYADKKPTFKPDIAGGVKSLLPKLFQEVYYTYMKNGEWMWLTQPLFQREPRTCYPVPSYLPMDWSIIINRRWNEYYNADADAQFKAELAAEQEKEAAELKIALLQAESIAVDGGAE